MLPKRKLPHILWMHQQDRAILRIAEIVHRHAIALAKEEPDRDFCQNSLSGSVKDAGAVHRSIGNRTYASQMLWKPEGLGASAILRPAHSAPARPKPRVQAEGNKCTMLFSKRKSTLILQFSAPFPQEGEVL